MCRQVKVSMDAMQQQMLDYLLALMQPVFLFPPKIQKLDSGISSGQTTYKVGCVLPMVKSSNGAVLRR